MPKKKPFKRLWLKQLKNEVESSLVFPNIGVPQNGWFMRENPVRIDDLGVPLFFGNTQFYRRHDPEFIS